MRKPACPHVLFCEELVRNCGWMHWYVSTVAMVVLYFYVICSALATYIDF